MNADLSLDIAAKEVRELPLIFAAGFIGFRIEGVRLNIGPRSGGRAPLALRSVLGSILMPESQECFTCRVLRLNPSWGPSRRQIARGERNVDFRGRCAGFAASAAVCPRPDRQPILWRRICYRATLEVLVQDPAPSDVGDNIGVARCRVSARSGTRSTRRL